MFIEILDMTKIYFCKVYLQNTFYNFVYRITKQNLGNMLTRGRRKQTSLLIPSPRDNHHFSYFSCHFLNLIPGKN